MSRINHTDKKIVPNVEKLPLAEYYRSLPKAERRPVIISAPRTDLVNALAKLCYRDPHTVKRWLYGYNEPFLSEKKRIAEFLGCSVECLWPQKEEVSV
jgi:hypothetical protein